MLRPEPESQSALDDALKAQEREMDQLLSTLGPADAPPDLVDAVLARITPQTHTAASQPVVHPVVRRSVPKRGMTVNKKIIFALAAAAVVVLAVITYTNRQPATTGTEATIGAAQRGQAPQIAASDVQLGDTEAQEFFQSEVFDELINDENTRTLLRDASIRQELADLDLRRAVEDSAVREALRAPALKTMLEDRDLSRRLEDSAAYAKKITDSNVRSALNNAAFVSALRKPEVRMLFARPAFVDVVSRPAFAKAVQARGWSQAMQSRRFDDAMARADARLAARGVRAPAARDR